MIDWNKKVKRVLKAELIRKGVTHSHLATLLNQIGESETKASIDSKISRGSFSASFLFKSLSVIGCKKIEFEDLHGDLTLAAEPKEDYK